MDIIELKNFISFRATVHLLRTFRSQSSESYGSKWRYAILVSGFATTCDKIEIGKAFNFAVVVFE
jgi:hypothetical protein